MKASVRVFLKPGVLDVQGKAVENALHGLGWPQAANVRVGKVITFDLTGGDPARARSDVEAMCQRLLANPVIESYQVEIAS
jgi:phosphoribosylformylglycinamidine synthase